MLPVNLNTTYLSLDTLPTLTLTVPTEPEQELIFINFIWEKMSTILNGQKYRQKWTSLMDKNGQV